MGRDEVPRGGARLVEFRTRALLGGDAQALIRHDRERGALRKTL